jgi:hypothetical protein
MCGALILKKYDGVGANQLVCQHQLFMSVFQAKDEKDVMNIDHNNL